MVRTRIGIVFGGCSEEHPISVKSAVEVARHLDPVAYDPCYLGITSSGEWLLCDDPAPGWEHRGRPAVLCPDRGVHGVLVLVEGRFETVRLDVVLPVLHGRFGEDGSIQGLLELAGIPYVGCDIQSSAVCMDKSLTYAVARSAGIATPDFRIVEADDVVASASLELPVYVKPARSGSSFGVTKVERGADLTAAIDEARRYDSRVLIEGAVVGAEIGCAVLGNGSDPIVGELDRISLTHGLFRIHQEESPETGSDNSTIEVPADLPAFTRDRVRETGVAVYRALGCRGLARVDLFLTDAGDVVLNEVNTLPGLTSYSRYPRMMAAAGLPLGTVLDRLVALALDEAR